MNKRMNGMWTDVRESMVQRRKTDALRCDDSGISTLKFVQPVRAHGDNANVHVPSLVLDNALAIFECDRSNQPRRSD